MKNGDTKKVLAASIYAVHQIGDFSGLICVSDRSRMISAPVLLTETDKEEAAMMKKESFRRILIRVFWCSLIFTLGFSWIYIRYAVPDKLNLVVNEEEVFHFSLPPGITFESDSEEVILKNSSDIPDGMIRIDRPDSVSMCGKNEGSYLVGMKFLGLIRMKEIQVDVVDSSCAIPCGTPVGIYLSSKGVMVIGTGQVTNKTGNVVEPAYGLLKSGDYIQTINGETLEDKDALVDAVNASGGKAMILGIRRDGREIDVNMTPVLADDGHYKLGAWVRDDTQGIGTVTYMDLNGKFGALGHGISDSDTGELVETSGGNLYDAQILGIEKGKIGTPGMLSGVIYYGPKSEIGTVTENTDYGIFGTVSQTFLKEHRTASMEAARRQEVKTGPALVRTSISGQVKDYSVEIQRIDMTGNKKNKSLVIKITDPELLNLTGGIIQGTSGSPVIQNGKIIGAITHVFVQDPTRGYGILIEDMLGH